MSNYVLSFRSKAGQSADPEHEAAWGEWFEQIGASVVDFGHRVGRGTLLGRATRLLALSCRDMS